MERTTLCILIIFSLESFITSGSPMSNLFNGRHNIGRINKNHNNASENELKSGNMVEFDRQIRNEIKSDFTVAPASATKDNGYDPKIEKQKIHLEKSLRNRDASFTPMIPVGANVVIPKSFVPEIPEECLETGLCETVPNYPEEYFTWIIETYYLDLVIENKKTRIKNTQRNEPQYLCNVTTKEVNLKAIASNDGNWYFVLNSNKLPLQTYETQLCIKTKDQDCARDVVFSRYTSQCIQLRLQQIVIVSDSTGTISAKTHPIPSGCYCAISVTT